MIKFFDLSSLTVGVSLFTTSLAQAPYFDDLLDIVVPYAPAEKYLQVRGRCWAEGLYLKGVQYYNPADDPFKHAVLHPSPEDATKIHEVTFTFTGAIMLGETRSAAFQVCLDQ